MDWLTMALIGVRGGIRTRNCKLKHDMSLLETISLIGCWKISLQHCYRSMLA